MADEDAVVRIGIEADDQTARGFDPATKRLDEVARAMASASKASAAAANAVGGQIRMTAAEFKKLNDENEKANKGLVETGKQVEAVGKKTEQHVRRGATRDFDQFGRTARDVTAAVVRGLGGVTTAAGAAALAIKLAKSSLDGFADFERKSAQLNISLRLNAEQQTKYNAKLKELTELGFPIEELQQNFAQLRAETGMSQDQAEEFFDTVAHGAKNANAPLQEVRVTAQRLYKDLKIDAKDLSAVLAASNKELGTNTEAYHKHLERGAQIRRDYHFAGKKAAQEDIALFDVLGKKLADTNVASQGAIELLEMVKRGEGDIGALMAPHMPALIAKGAGPAEVLAKTAEVSKQLPYLQPGGTPEEQARKEMYAQQRMPSGAAREALRGLSDLDVQRQITASVLRQERERESLQDQYNKALAGNVQAELDKLAAAQAEALRRAGERGAPTERWASELI